MRFSLSDCQPPLHTLHTFQELNFLGGGFIQFREATNEVTIPEGFRQSIGNYFGRYGGDYGGYHDRMCFVCLDYINRAIGFASSGTDAISLEHRLQLFPLLAYAVENWHYDVQPTTGYMKRAAAYLRDDEIIRIMMQIQRKIQFESQPDGVSSQELSQRHRWDTTRLNYAVSIGNYHLVEAFLICGCNPNGEADHQPPLISAVMNRHSNIVRLLVGYGANVSIVDFANRTPLYLAVFQNDFATVQYLLSTRARGDLNHQMEMTDRMTPLMAAICNGNLQIAEILLHAEPQVYLQACDGQTALSYALPKSEFRKLAIRMFELGVRKETWTSQSMADITLYEAIIEITDRAVRNQVTACLWKIDEALRTQGPSVDYEKWSESFVRKFLDNVTADSDLTAIKKAVAEERRRLKMMLPLGNNLRQRYMLRRAVGIGAFSGAWEAMDLVERKFVAVKFLLDPKNTSNCDDAAKERKFMRGMNHPNVLKCLDFMTTQGVPVNITEFASQGDLWHYLRKHCRYGLPDAIAKIMFRQIMEGLIYLVGIPRVRSFPCYSDMHQHAQDVVHSDLKSLNILVFENNLVKIADFGNSKRIPAKDYGYVHQVPCTPTRMPQHVLLHTYPFEPGPTNTIADIAPEAIDDEEASEEWILAKPCDVYSAGVCLYELLAGKEPFNTPGSETDYEELYRQIREGDLRFDNYVMWGTHDDLAMHLLARMMNLDPKKRPTAEQVLAHPWLTPNPARQNMLDTFGLREPHARKPTSFNAHRPEWITSPPRTRRGDHSYSEGLDEEFNLFAPPSRRKRADACLSQELNDFRKEYDFSVHPPRLGY